MIAFRLGTLSSLNVYSFLIVDHYTVYRRCAARSPHRAVRINDQHDISIPELRRTVDAKDAHERVQQRPDDNFLESENTIDCQYNSACAGADNQAFRRRAGDQRQSE